MPFINTVFNLEVINVVLGSVLIAQVGAAGASTSAAGQERTTENVFAPGFDAAEKARQALKLWLEEGPCQNCPGSFLKTQIPNTYPVSTVQESQRILMCAQSNSKTIPSCRQNLQNTFDSDSYIYYAKF